jgi:hypothetical protein
VEALGSFSYRSFAPGAIALQGGRYCLETLSRELGVEAHRLAPTPSRPSEPEADGWIWVGVASVKEVHHHWSISDRST